MKTHLYSAFAPLKIGNDILANDEHIKADVFIAQGGLFKTPEVGQQVLADALDTPITVMSNAGEGGPWGMAVLASIPRTTMASKVWPISWTTRSLLILKVSRLSLTQKESRVATNLSKPIRRGLKLNRKLLNQLNFN